MYDPRLHLFVDDHGLVKCENLGRVVGRPKKHPTPVVRQDRPWESPLVCAWGSAVHNPETGRFQMWYCTIGHREKFGMIRVCYAESGDGVDWHKPGLGLYAYGGHNSTNIVLTGTGLHEDTPEGRQMWEESGARFLGEGPDLLEFVTHLDGPNIVWDQTEPEPGKRYKHVGCMWRREDNGSWSHNLMTSPDGIRWDMPPVKVLEGINDGTKVQWDPIRKIWILTWLSCSVLDTGEVVRYLELAESDDLRNWTMAGKPFELDEADGFGRVMQGHFLMPFAYGDQYVGVANMIHTREGWCQGFLVSSRDGRNWERPLRRDPFVCVGSEEDFDADSAEAAISAPFIVGDQMYIYYCGRSKRHWGMGAVGAIGLLRLKRDRFAGLANGGWFNRGCDNRKSVGGEIVTKPVEVTGPTLYVNARTRGGEGPPGPGPDGRCPGAVRTEIQDERREAIPGYTLADSVPFRGDEVRGPMRWKSRNDVAELQGRKVHVRFCIDMATVYAYIFA